MSKPLGIDQPHVIHRPNVGASRICIWIVIMDEIELSRLIYLDSYQVDANGITKLIGPRLRLVYEDGLANGYDYEAKQATVDETIIQIARSRERNRQHLRSAELFHSNHDSQSPPVCIDGRPELKLHPGQGLYGFVLYDVCAKVDVTVYTTIELAYAECLRLAQELRLEESIGNAWHFGSVDPELFFSSGSLIADYRARHDTSSLTRLL